MKWLNRMKNRVSNTLQQLMARKALNQPLIQDERGMELGTILAVLGISLVLILIIFAFAKPWVQNLIQKMQQTTA